MFPECRRDRARSTFTRALWTLRLARGIVRAALEGVAMNALSRIFTWWNGQTVGTWWHTRRHGQRVGEDEQGNVFYQTADGARRWVIFNGVSEASRVSPDWHGWLHHTFDAPPDKAPFAVRKWEKQHLPNLTGTAAAYVPPGSITTPATRSPATGDYQAWTPN
jgi:NADH:ubiquinone oxidoreductase subunit